MLFGTVGFILRFLWAGHNICLKKSIRKGDFKNG